MKRFPVLCGLLALTMLVGCGDSNEGTYQGYVEGEYVYVASPLAGTLTSLDVARGDHVSAEQSLFQLDDEVEAAELRRSEHAVAEASAQLDDVRKGLRPSEIAALEAQRDRARATLTLAESQLERAKRLHAAEDPLISDEELEQAEAQRDADRAQLAQAEADLKTARLGGRTDAVRAAEARLAEAEASHTQAAWSVEQKHRAAPASAFVDDTLYDVGEWVGAGRPVVVLLPPENRKARFFVPEPVLARVAPGRNVSVHLDGLDRPLEATISYVSSEAEFTPPVIYSKQNRSKLVYMVEATFPPDVAENLRPGQPLDVRLEVESP
ncbi:MAG: HlyD family efflux transporter periplasmic adaptor subunit [bacterium]